jgi:type II secretory pathway pseudopilin PulG
MKTKNNSAGFALVELILVLLVVAVIVLIGLGLKQDNDSKQVVAQFDAKQLKSEEQNQSTSTTPTQTAVTTTPAQSIATTTPTTIPVTKSQPKPITTPAVITPSSSDIFNAEADANSVDTMLSIYGFANNFYLSELEPQILVDTANTSGSGFNVGMFTLPTGLSLQYLPTPSGCTTASQNCINYTLNVVESNGSTIYTKTGFPLK